MKVLFIFLDGIGLGEGDPLVNPLVSAQMPTLQSLLGGVRLVQGSAPQVNGRASLHPLDACLDIDGFPQSASGQAVLLTGRNIPAEIGYHYGPKPNPEINRLLRQGTIFSRIVKSRHKAALLNAYPPGYFKGIHSGRRLYSAIPLAVTLAGIPLKTKDDLYAGQALAADFTGEGWRDHLGFGDVPVLTPTEAGQRLSLLAQELDFSLFEYWLSDYAGHRQDMAAALSLLEKFDLVLDGLLANWDPQKGLILITSDHGNLEDLSTRRHTRNPVPALLIGSNELRAEFSHELRDLTGIAPAILRVLGIP